MACLTGLSARNSPVARLDERLVPKMQLTPGCSGPGSQGDADRLPAIAWRRGSVAAAGLVAVAAGRGLFAGLAQRRRARGLRSALMAGRPIRDIRGTRTATTRPKAAWHPLTP